MHRKPSLGLCLVFAGWVLGDETLNLCRHVILNQQAQYIDPMLGYGWANNNPALGQCVVFSRNLGPHTNSGQKFVHPQSDAYYTDGRLP